MPDREYPAGALEAVAASYAGGGTAATKFAQEDLDLLAAMSPEDRAALRLFLDPEARQALDALDAEKEPDPEFLMHTALGDALRERDEARAEVARLRSIIDRPDPHDA